MNRDDRNKLKRAIQAYDCCIRKADCIFERKIEEMRDSESDKIDRLPQALSSSRMAEELDDAVGMLDSIIENAQSIIEQLDEILASSDVSSCYSDTKPENAVNAKGKKDVSFHALLPTSLVLKLKEESHLTGISMNELVCQAISTKILIADQTE